MELSRKQQRFITEYLEDQNATQAAIRAGYSKKTANEQGCRLLAKVSIREEIDLKLGDVADRVGVTVEFVLEGLKEVFERCLQRKPVMTRDPKDGRKLIQETDDEGQGVWEFDAMGANRSLELMGKYKKMFTDKVEHTGKDGKPLSVKIVNYGNHRSV